MSEMDALLRNSKEAWARTQVVVKRVLGEKHTLQFMSLTDRKRLTVFLVWEQRYKVPLEWIVEVLLDHYSAIRKRFITGRHRRNPALPVKVVSLVSQTSKELLQKAIAVAYPADEHLDIWREREQYRTITKQTPSEERKVLEPTFLEYKTTSAFIRAYSESIEEHRLIEQKISDGRKKGKPYRNSPWR
jgi:hypothetical protein